MFYFDEKTFIDLEFDQIRTWLAESCQTQVVAYRMNRLNPLRDPQKVEQSLQLTNDLQSIRNGGLPFPRLELQDIKDEIKLLSISGAVLQIESLIKLLETSLLVNDLCTFFKKQKENYPHLRTLLGEAYHTTEIEEAMGKVLDKRLQIRDDASEKLKDIRQRIKNCRKKINQNFENALRTASNKGYIDSIRENIVGTRRVLAVLSSYKRQVAGNILGGSKTGSLTYVEPQVNIALNFELDQLIDDEQKEIHRILSELSDFFRTQLPLLEEYKRIIYDFDEVNAKEKLAQKINGVMPKINHHNQDTHLRNAYHPLLYVKNKELDHKTIPQTFELTQSTRLLVISGPNAGGKSITLKTVGLLQVMFQAGLMVSIDSESTMAFFDYVLSDIGDNQSIENQLSTYSYRLQRMNFFLKKMTPKTLLLLDEFGTGSDPDLGGALAEVFFETIYKEGCFGVITTHYSNIKLAASELPEAVNANMLFNRQTLSPEFQLVIGQPGSSFTFEVAQKNGIPHSMLKEAKAKVDGQKVRFDQLISDLQKDKSILRKLKKESYEARQEMEEAKLEFEERKQHFDERLETQQKRIERNDKYISQGKKMYQFIQNYPSKSKTKQIEYLKEVKKYLVIEKTKKEEAARKAKEEAKKPKKVIAAKPKKKRPIQPPKPPAPPKPVVVGGKVRLKDGNQVGEVLEIVGEETKVMFGSLVAKVKKNKLIGV